MLSMGEFAQLSGLTVKALRNYDERGLLVPAQVDPETRYRFYAGSQLRDAVTIKVLRDADVPVGALPPRRELVARWVVEGCDGAGKTAHPAVVALLEAMEARSLGTDVSAVRQIGYADADGRIGVELAVAID
jgi:hypothetical protein